MNGLTAIRQRADTHTNRPPAPVINRNIVDQMHRDILFLLSEIERMEAAR